MRLVLDTNVLVAALRSRTAASHALLRHLFDGRFAAIGTPALLFEYEAVLSRPERLVRSGMADEALSDVSTISRTGRCRSFRACLGNRNSLTGQTRRC